MRAVRICKPVKELIQDNYSKLVAKKLKNLVIKLSYALQSTLNQFGGEYRIAKLSDEAYLGSFLINELVKAGSGVIVTTNSSIKSIVALATDSQRTDM
ncbi:uncharacterized protein RJT21DRAFT_2268 [Scheffersomyces amazonensis]|uniref:uncharacterized protein n=1 Tax=Scheffersomyces amazonensis TaxID=1078765 RepID=UPI00315CA2A1